MDGATSEMCWGEIKVEYSCWMERGVVEGAYLTLPCNTSHIIHKIKVYCENPWPKHSNCASRLVPLQGPSEAIYEYLLSLIEWTASYPENSALNFTRMVAQRLEKLTWHWKVPGSIPSRGITFPRYCRFPYPWSKSIWLCPAIPNI